MYWYVSTLFVSKQRIQTTATSSYVYLDQETLSTNSRSFIMWCFIFISGESAKSQWSEIDFFCFACTILPRTKLSGRYSIRRNQSRTADSEMGRGGSMGTSKAFTQPEREGRGGWDSLFQLGPSNVTHNDISSVDSTCW